MKTPYQFKIVRDADAADFDSVRVALFRSDFFVCGWYISPATATPMGDGYLAKSTNTLASAAILRAVAIADRLGVEVCIIDPDDLWDEVWRG